MPYPICSIVAVFKMLVRILNTLRSRIWDMPVFLFSDYTKPTVGENGELVFGFEEEGIVQKSMVFIEMKISRWEYLLTE